MVHLITCASICTHTYVTNVVETVLNFFTVTINDKANVTNIITSKGNCSYGTIDKIDVTSELELLRGHRRVRK